MFATLLGALPRPRGDPHDLDELVRIAIRAQEEAGLEPITDGRLRGFSLDGVPELREVLAAWRFAASATSRAVKQVLPGPYTVARRSGEANDAGGGGGRVRAVERLREIIEGLASAGCPLIEIEETDAHLIGDDAREREQFRTAHLRLTEGIAGTHLSLSISGGSAWSAGLETIIDAPYASLALDLISGPDNWNLVTRLPGDRGVIAGALPAKDSPADAKETLLWAARYAAGTRGRGLDRVGLGSAGSWANLTWEAALAKLQRLGEAARLAAMPAGPALARQLDPRAVSARTAALGHTPEPGERPVEPGERSPEPGERPVEPADEAD
jgi:methionine synthase II (cobalamin-independent)